MSGNDAGLPENMLAPGQPSPKLHEDLVAARNSVDLLAQMLAPITLTNPAAVKQVRRILLVMGPTLRYTVCFVHMLLNLSHLRL